MGQEFVGCQGTAGDDRFNWEEDLLLERGGRLTQADVSPGVDMSEHNSCSW